MTAPVFRNPDKFQQLPFRDFIRDRVPPPAQGFVAEDLDLVLRRFNPAVTGDRGRFRLVECKHGNAGFGRSKSMTFGLIDKLLRLADPESRRYDGFYLVQTNAAEWDDLDEFYVNGWLLEQREFVQWLRWERPVPRWDFAQSREAS